MLLHWLSLRIPCVHLDNCTLEPKHIVGHVFFLDPAHRLLTAGLHAPELEARRPSNGTAASLLQALSSRATRLQKNLRLLMIAYGCEYVVSKSDSETRDWNITKLLLLQGIVLDWLPIEKRPQQLEASSGTLAEDLKVFLSKFYEGLAQCGGQEWNGVISSYPENDVLADLVDEVILMKLAKSLSGNCEHLGLSSEQQQVGSKFGAQG